MAPPFGSLARHHENELGKDRALELRAERDIHVGTRAVRVVLLLLKWACHGAELRNRGSTSSCSEG